MRKESDINPAKLRPQFGLANPVVRVRSKRGYSATNYDVNPAARPESLRCQLGEKYDQKKVRNN
jgi:hypothetical protein